MIVQIPGNAGPLFHMAVPCGSWVGAVPSLGLGAPLFVSPPLKGTESAARWPNVITFVLMLMSHQAHFPGFLCLWGRGAFELRCSALSPLTCLGAGAGTEGPSTVGRGSPRTRGRGGDAAGCIQHLCSGRPGRRPVR